MAPLTETEYKDMIVEEVGDSASGLVASRIDTSWAMYESERDMYRQYLRAKRKSIDLLMGSVREQVTAANRGQSVELSTKLRNLQIMRDAVTDELGDEAKIERSAASGRRRAVLGQLAGPDTPPNEWSPDGNDPAYRGDLYRRRG